MTGLVFEVEPPLILPVPNRADVACFIGLVARRDTDLPEALHKWLIAQGWLQSPANNPGQARPDLLDLPVPLESWEMFDRLFAWDRRPRQLTDTPAIQEGSQDVTPYTTSSSAEPWSHTYLGAAVRSFFAQGGRRCYVVRVGDPLPLNAPREQRRARLAKLLPGYPQRLSATPLHRDSWRGIGLLFGLPDVSYVGLPDLPDLVACAVPLLSMTTQPSQSEQFVECTQAQSAPTDQRAVVQQEPRCDLGGYAVWASALALVANLLRRLQREVQLVAALPLPLPESDGEIALQDYLALLIEGEGIEADPPAAGEPVFVPPLAYGVGDHPQGLASAFVQLVYPWVRTPGSLRLPGQLESPEGVLIGLLARNALTRGSFRSAAGLPLADVNGLEPTLTRAQLFTPHGQPRPNTLLERVSLLGPTPAGLRLLSDVTTSQSDSYRPASVNRLVTAIVRAARSLGEAVSFEPAAESLWNRLKSDLDALLLGLWQAGALAGASPGQAFSVRCDRTTTRQADLDNGRVIAEVQFSAAVPIEQIHVVLAMSQGGQVSLVSVPP
jgi:uncharacterized protein